MRHHDRSNERKGHVDRGQAHRQSTQSSSHVTGPHERLRPRSSLQRRFKVVSSRRDSNHQRNNDEAASCDERAQAVSAHESRWARSLGGVLLEAVEASVAKRHPVHHSPAKDHYETRQRNESRIIHRAHPRRFRVAVMSLTQHQPCYRDSEDGSCDEDQAYAAAPSGDSLGVHRKERPFFESALPDPLFREHRDGCTSTVREAKQRSSSR
jgi:hypothetical protein